jgi:hypothetical protein
MPGGDRHIHSSLLNDLRVPVKIAQEQLGHASISKTLNIYTHVVDGSHRRAIEQLEAELFPTGSGLPAVARGRGKGGPTVAHFASYGGLDAPDPISFTKSNTYVVSFPGPRAAPSQSRRWCPREKFLRLGNLSLRLHSRVEHEILQSSPTPLVKAPHHRTGYSPRTFAH